MSGRRAQLIGYGTYFRDPRPERIRGPPASQSGASGWPGGSPQALSHPAAPHDQAPARPPTAGPSRPLRCDPGRLSRGQPPDRRLSPRPRDALLPLAPPPGGSEAGAGAPATPRGPSPRRRPRGLALPRPDARGDLGSPRRPAHRQADQPQPGGDQGRAEDPPPGGPQQHGGPGPRGPGPAPLRAVDQLRDGPRAGHQGIDRVQSLHPRPRAAQEDPREPARGPGGDGTMSEDSSTTDPVGRLAESFVARYRRGERPALSEYTDRYPELADRIREVFPMMVLIEEAGSGGDASSGATGRVAAQSLGGGREGPDGIAGYRIRREVGRGGMGIVYEAEQLSLGRHVALKVLPASIGQDPRGQERFRREARAAARLHHTNIVPVHEVGQDRGVFFYAMQFIEGQALDAVLEELKALRRNPPATPGRGPQAAPSAAAAVAHSLLTGRTRA